MHRETIYNLIKLLGHEHIVSNMSDCTMKERYNSIKSILANVRYRIKHETDPDQKLKLAIEEKCMTLFRNYIFQNRIILIRKREIHDII
jgi:hypothetical protein